MSDIKGINEKSLVDMPQRFIANADTILANIENISSNFEATATSFMCPEADQFRSKVSDDMKTSNNISKNLNTNATDLVKIMSQYESLDSEQSASIIKNIDNVDSLSERRVI